jgi:hypothetical protein
MTDECDLLPKKERKFQKSSICTYKTFKAHKEENINA